MLKSARRIGMMLTAEIDKALAVIGAQRELAQLLDDIKAFIRRYVVVTDHEFVALSLWVIHTYCFLTGDYTPYINITSATASAGKTRVLEVLELLVRNPELADSITTAALIRTVDEDQPTLLVDEMDAYFGGNTDRAEAMRGILNGGFSRKGKVILCEGPQHKRRKLKTFCPKAFAGIGRDHLPETIRTRSIPIAMKRKRRDETVEKLRERKVRAEVNTLKKQIAAWSERNTAYLEDAEPEPAIGLTDRGDDVSEPLLVIAEIAGAMRAKKVRAAMTKLLAETNRSDDDVGVELLRDIFELVPRDVPFISTEGLLSKLCDLEERPWATWGHGNPMTGRALARRLKEFGICPTHKEDRSCRGYYRDRFLDAWGRYEVGLSPEEASKRPAPNKTGVEQEVSTRPEKRPADGWPSQDPPINTGVSDTWTGETGGEAVELLPQKHELQVQRAMRSAEDHDERVQNENEWIRRSKEKKTEVTEI